MPLRWYAVSVLSNFENRVAEAIRDGVSQKGLEAAINDVLVPTETVAEVRRGKRINMERRIMPGYVLVQADMVDEAYHLIKDTRNVIGFLGPQGKPMPMSDDEVARILNKAEERDERVAPQILFEIGEKVKVIDGPFETFEGKVEDIDADNARLKVTVSIFGRETPVDLEYGQVEKLSD